jgi:hypothetical protein
MIPLDMDANIPVRLLLYASVLFYINSSGKIILYKVNCTCVHMRFGAFHAGSVCVGFKSYLIQFLLW